MKDVAIVAYCRTAIAKAGRGALNQTHGIPMAAHVLRQVVERAKIDAAEVGFLQLNRINSIGLDPWDRDMTFS